MTLNPWVGSTASSAMNDRALNWLAGCRKNGWPLRYLKVDPDFDNIRSDPRFVELLKSMGLEE